VLVPPLRELEVYIFERLFRYLWQKALLESVKREPSGGAMFSPHMMTPTHKASQHEDAIQRWLDALQVCCHAHAWSKQSPDGVKSESIWYVNSTSTVVAEQSRIAQLNVTNLAHKCSQCVLLDSVDE